MELYCFHSIDSAFQGIVILAFNTGYSSPSDTGTFTRNRRGQQWSISGDDREMHIPT